MGIADWFLLAIRWLHAVAAAAWIGGSLFFALVLRPSLQGTPHEGALNRVAGQEFRNLVDVAISVLLFTGVIMSINRLTSGHATAVYGVVLGTKVFLAAWMGHLVWSRQRRRAGQPVDAVIVSRYGVQRLVRAALSANNLLVILGIIIFLLADVLAALFEQSIVGR